jgi:hypothetical protein
MTGIEEKGQGKIFSQGEMGTLFARIPRRLKSAIPGS